VPATNPSTPATQTPFNSNLKSKSTNKGNNNSSTTNSNTKKTYYPTEITIFVRKQSPTKPTPTTAIKITT
jgi:hypothetical protein